MEIHKILGKGLLEIIYKDALELELKSNGILIKEKRNMKWYTKGLY